MEKLDSYIDRNLFNQKVVDLIVENLDNSEALTDEVVAVHKITKELKMISISTIGSDWDTYPILSFIRVNEFGTGKEVDIDATLDLTDTYYFLR